LLLPNFFLSPFFKAFSILVALLLVGRLK